MVVVRARHGLPWHGSRPFDMLQTLSFLGTIKPGHRMARGKEAGSPLHHALLSQQTSSDVSSDTRHRNFRTYKLISVPETPRPPGMDRAGDLPGTVRPRH